ncbi:hypothetical protein KEM48_000372 [Puccinia striiformis f. sp. tritici PST-130]|nr:hypothetical protein KEM48_000372 [Puccinia striiformis f. sp. tritici PST-130]
MTCFAAHLASCVLKDLEDKLSNLSSGPGETPNNELAENLLAQQTAIMNPNLTPEENQNLINHYLTLVKQQRANNPPPPPFVDPLTLNERLDRIIKNVLADREAELDHRIFFNQSLRDYRADKRIHGPRDERTNQRSPPTLHSKDFDAITFKKRFEALEKALNNDRLNSPQEKKNAAVFNARFEEYKAALIQAQEVEVQATQKGDKTIIPTSKILKLETRREPLDLTIPQVTGNVHLDKHLAQTPITEKPVDKKNKATKKKILPLDSSIGDLSISSFTTEPFFEDLEPTLKRITPKRALPVISDSESEAGISIDHPSSPVLEKITRKPALPILSDSEDELDEDLATPILNPSTLIPKDEQNNLKIRSRSSKPRRNRANTPNPWGLSANPLVGRKSSLQRDGQRIRERGRDSGSGNHPDPHQKAGEDPRQVPESDLERRKESNLGPSPTEPARPPETHPEQGNRELRERVESLGRKEESVPGPAQEQEETEIRQTEPTSSKRKQPPRPNPLELQPRPNSLDQQSQPNPFKHEQRPRSVEQQLKTDSLEPNNKRYREESEDLEDPVRWKEVHRATAVLGAFFRHTKR